MLYVFKKKPETILSVNFGLFGENFVTSFIKQEIKRQRSWKKYVRLVLKIYERIFGFKNFSRHEKCLVITRVEKALLCQHQN